MAITLAKTVANVIARGGGVFISPDAGVTYHDFGRVKNVELDITPVETEADTAGRTVQLAAEVVGNFVVTQTGATEFANLDQIHAVATNGVWLKFTSVFTNAAGAGAAAGFTFKNVFPVVGGKIKFDNSESQLNFSIKGRCNMADLAGLGAAGADIAFDA